MCAERVCVGYEEDITAWWIFRDREYNDQGSSISGQDYIVVYPKEIRLCEFENCTFPLHTIDLSQLGSPASSPHSIDFNGKKSLNINYTISDPSFPGLSVTLSTYLLEQQTILPQPSDDNDLFEVFENDFLLVYDWTYLNQNTSYFLEFSTQMVHFSGCFSSNTTGNQTTFEFNNCAENETEKVGYAVTYPFFGVNYAGNYQLVNISTDYTNTTTFIANYSVGYYTIVIDSGFTVSTGWTVALCILAVFIFVLVAAVGGFYAWRWWKKRKYKKIRNPDEGLVEWDKVERW